MANLPEVISALVRDVADQVLQTGQVTALSGDQVVVAVQGAELILPKLSSYDPRTGDVVLVLTAPGRRIVLGRPGAYSGGTGGGTGADGRGISAAEINAAGHLILTYTDGTSTDVGLVVGPPGPTGEPGRGINSGTVDAAGHLILTYTDGTSTDAGLVVGPEGGGGPHADTHAVGGADPLTPDAIGAAGAPVRTEAALAAALAAGGEVRVDSATTITLGATLVLDRPTRLLGGHLLAPAEAPALRVTSPDVEIAGVRIDGPGITGPYAGTQKLIHVLGTAAAPLTGIAVHDCRLSGSRGDAIWVEWCEGASIAHNHIRDVLYSGVMVISGVAVKVIGNDIENGPLSTGVVNTYGIAVTDTANTLAARSRDCLVLANRVHLIDWEGIDTHGGDGLIVSGNHVTGCPRGIALVLGNETRVAAPQRCVVVGNRVDGAGSRQPLREAITLAGKANVPADAIITGNQLTGYGAPYWLDYTARGVTTIAANEPVFRGWTALSLDGDFTANATYPPEWMIDGNTVWLRGGAIPRSATQRTRVGRITDPYAWPTTLTFIGYIKGSNAGAGNGMLAVDATGVISLFYGSGTDTFTYFLHGSYVAA